MVSAAGLARLAIAVVVSLALLLISAKWFDDVFGEGATENLSEAGKKLYTYMFRTFDLEAKRLKVPHRDHNVTIAQVKAYLPRSLIGICGWQRIMNGDCFCKKYIPINRVSNDTEDAAAVIAMTDSMLLVSFRPTSSDINRQTNLDFELVPLPGADEGIKVHKGFLKYYQSIQVPLESQIVSLLRKNRTLVLHLTGYSLGGSVALISLGSMVRRLNEKNLTNDVEVYSYASPRVGNQAFADYIETLNIPVIRYSIKNDMVSQLPPRKFGYVHAGIEFFSYPEGIKRCSLSYDEDPQCALNSTSLALNEHYHPNQQPIPEPIFC